MRVTSSSDSKFLILTWVRFLVSWGRVMESFWCSLTAFRFDMSTRSLDRALESTLRSRGLDILHGDS